jgi:glutaredoxin
MRSRREVRSAATIARNLSDAAGCATFFGLGGPGVAMGRETDIVLYQAEWCPYCARVRKKLTDLLLDYKNVNVPHSHAQRDEVKKVSGQTSIPVLVDGEVVLDDDDDIIPYLDKTYGAAAKAS